MKQGVGEKYCVRIYVYFFKKTAKNEDILRLQICVKKNFAAEFA